jgi:6-phosphogluconolactonase
LTPFQTISTLPEGYAGPNSCAQIQIDPSGRFLYAPNRGHDSVACYTVDTATGELASNGIVASEARPNALCLGPHDRFIYSAGQDSGQMAIFRVDQDSGALHRMETVPLGGGPCWISVVELPG